MLHDITTNDRNKILILKLRDFHIDVYNNRCNNLHLFGIISDKAEKVPDLNTNCSKKWTADYRNNC